MQEKTKKIRIAIITIIALIVAIGAYYFLIQNDAVDKNISQEAHLPCSEGDIYNTDTGKMCPEDEEPPMATSTPLSETGV